MARRLTILLCLAPFVAASWWHNWHDACFITLGLVLGAVASRQWPRTPRGYQTPLSRRRDEAA